MFIFRGKKSKSKWWQKQIRKYLTNHASSQLSAFKSYSEKKRHKKVVLPMLVSHKLYCTLTFAAAAESLQSCPTLCDPIDGSPPGPPIPGILQARTLEWVAISSSNAWKWKVKSEVVSDSSGPHGLQPTRLLHPWDSPGKSTGVGCHCLLWL